jgi:hypothetical protein
MTVVITVSGSRLLTDTPPSERGEFFAAWGRFRSPIVAFPTRMTVVISNT